MVYFVLELTPQFIQHIQDNKIDKVHVPAQWNKEQNYEYVSSLGKLKTLEYRILRKLREKLKHFTLKAKGKKQ